MSEKIFFSLRHEVIQIVPMSRIFSRQVYDYLLSARLDERIPYGLPLFDFLCRADFRIEKSQRHRLAQIPQMI